MLGAQILLTNFKTFNLSISETQKTLKKVVGGCDETVGWGGVGWGGHQREKRTKNVDEKRREEREREEVCK